MKSLIVGIVILAAAVLTAFSKDFFGCGPREWDYILIFLRGGWPVLAVIIGLIAVFIGIADMKDRAEAKKEEADAEKTEDKETQPAV